MTVRLSTTVRNIEKILSNPENVEIILRFFEFMKKIRDFCQRYQNNNLKAIIAYTKFVEPSISLDQVKSKSQIASFLDTKMKTFQKYDPDKTLDHNLE